MADYIVTMDTGERYLAHHGVKGMKWGVWNAETAARYNGVDGRKPKQSRLERKERKSLAKQYQRTLRDLDDDLKTQTINASVSYQVSRFYQDKAKKAQRRNDASAAKYDELSKRFAKRGDMAQKDRVETSKKLSETIKEANKQGMSWKTFPMEFSEQGMVGFGKHNDYRKKLDEASKVSLRDYKGYSTNASSGNYFNVKPSERMSEKRKTRWEDTHDRLQSYRPQRVVRYYY